MITLYDKDGKAKTMDGVDAREHLQMGGWFTAPPEDIPAEVATLPVDNVTSISETPAKRGRPRVEK